MQNETFLTISTIHMYIFVLWSPDTNLGSSNIHLVIYDDTIIYFAKQFPFKMHHKPILTEMIKSDPMLL